MLLIISKDKTEKLSAFTKHIRLFSIIKRIKTHQVRGLVVTVIISSGGNSSNNGKGGGCDGKDDEK